jgi:hypothetical protein
MIQRVPGFSDELEQRVFGVARTEENGQVGLGAAEGDIDQACSLRAT